MPVNRIDILAGDSDNLISHLDFETGISERQASFLASRVAYTTDAECARAMGIAPVTVTAWRKRNPEFARLWKQVVGDVRKHAVARMQTLFDQAIDTLEQSLSSPDERIRLKAVQMVLDYGGLAKSSDMRISVMNKTEMLLRAIRDGTADGTAGEGEVAGQIGMAGVAGQVIDGVSGQVVEAAALAVGGGAGGDYTSGKREVVEVAGEEKEESEAEERALADVAAVLGGDRLSIAPGVELEDGPAGPALRLNLAEVSDDAEDLADV